MATEADIPESLAVPLMEGGVNRNLIPGEFDYRPEIADYLAKSGHLEVLSKVQVETMSSSFEINAGASGGVKFLESSSVPKAPEEETREALQTCQADEIPYQAEKEMLENEKQKKKDENSKAAEETGSKESEVSCETEERAEKEERSQEISDASPYLRIDEEKTSGEEKIIDHIEVNNQVLADENPKSSDEKTLISDSQKEKERERKEEEDAEIKTSKEAAILDASSDSNKEVLIHTSENLDGNAETQTNVCLNNEEKGLKLAQPIENVATEKEGIRLDEIEEASSVVATSSEIQNDKDASTAIVENVEEKLGIPSVIAATDKSSTQEAGAEEVDKLEEDLGIVNKEESQETNNINENDMTPLVDKTEEKNNLEILSAPQAEEICLQEVEKTEISKVVSETCPDIVVERSQEEECQTEIVEKAPEAESGGAEKFKDETNPEQKLDSLVREEEVQQNIDEKQAVSEALAEESKDESGHSVIADEDNISDAVTTLGHSKDQPENDKIQTSSEVVSEEIYTIASRECSETIVTCAKEETSIENQEESFDKKEEEEKSIDIETIRDDGIPKDLPPTEPHEKNESSEIEIPNKIENELNVRHSVEHEPVLAEGGKLGKDSDTETQDQIRETNGTARDEEEQDVNDSQACESTKKPDSELPSEKGEVTTEPSSATSETDVETAKEVHKSNFEEKLDTVDAKKSIEKEETSQTEIHNLPTSEKTEKCHAEEENSDEVGSTAFLQEINEQNVPAVCIQEGAAPLKDEVEENEKARSTINEEVTDIGKVNDEPNTRDNVVHISSEVINEETVEKSQQTEKEVDASKGEETQGVSQELAKEGSVKNIQDDKCIEKSSSREISEESEAHKTMDSIANEAKESDDNPDSVLQSSLVKEEEGLQCQNLAVQQDLAEQINKDGGCSEKNDKEKENYTRSAEEEEHSEVLPKGEEVSEYILLKNEIIENIEQTSNVISVANDNTAEEAEMEKKEITNESITKSLSQENGAQDLGMNLQNDDNNVETSNKEIDGSKAEGTGDSIAQETTENDENPSATITTLLADRTASTESSETKSCAKVETAIENQEESFEKKDKEETLIDIDANKDDEIQKLENLPPTELNEKIEIAEVEISEKNIDELNKTPSMEQKLGKISDFESQDQVHKENETARDEQKLDENDSQACESTENTNLEHPLPGGAVTTEPSSEPSEINTEKLEKAQGLDSEEELKITDSETTINEDIHKEEACESEMHMLATRNGDSGKCHTEEVTSDNLLNTSFLPETVEQTSQAASVHEAPTALKDEVELNESTKSILSEEITDIGEVTDEQKKTDGCTQLLPEVNNEETVEITQQSEKEVYLDKGEDTEGQIIGEHNNPGITQESVDKELAEISQNDENKAEKSSNGEISEKSDAAETVDCTATEEKLSDESPNLVKEHENQESHNLTVVEASSIEEINEVNEHKEVTLKSEKDLEQTLEKNETEENVEQPLNVMSTETEVSALSHTDDNTIEEVVESSQCNEKETRTEKDEEVITESNIRSLLEDPVKNFHRDDNNAEKSNKEIFEKPEIVETVDGIVTEAKENDEGPDIIKEQENQQNQSITALEASREDDSGLAEVQKSNVTSAEPEAGSSSQTEDIAVEEGAEIPQCNEREVEIAKDEAVINESNITSYPQESVGHDHNKNDQNDDNNVENSNTEVFDKSDTAMTFDESLDLTKEQESAQSENLNILEASSKEKIDEDIASIDKVEDREKETQVAEIEEHNEVTLKSEEGMGQILKKDEPEENIEQPWNVMSAETEAAALSQTDDTAKEDGDQRSQCNERELEGETDKDDLNESNIKSLSYVSVAEDPLKNYQDDDINTKKIIEKSETTETSDIIVNEVKQNAESEDLVKKHESLHSEDLTTVEATHVEEIHEDESSNKKDEDRENNTGLPEIEQNEVILKREEDLEQSLQKKEHEAKENIEQPLQVISADTEAAALTQLNGSTVEEQVEKPPCNELEVEAAKDDDNVNERNVKSLSEEPVADDPVENFQNDKILEESEEARTDDNTSYKTNQSDESPSAPMSSSLPKEVESLEEVPVEETFNKIDQESTQSDNLIPEEVSTIDEEEEKSVASETETTNEIPDASHPVVPIREEETLQDKNINTTEALTDEKKEDDGSSLQASEDNDQLAEPINNNEKEASHDEYTTVAESEKKVGRELVESSADVTASETKAGMLSEKDNDITVPEGVGDIQNHEETVEKVKNESCEENLELELQKKEPKELVESSSSDVIMAETKAATLSEEVNDVAPLDESTAIQNIETIKKGKKEGHDDIEGSKVEEFPTSEDLKPAEETCVLSSIVENETVEERSMASEMELETIDKTHEANSVEKLKGDIGEEYRNTEIACLSEDTEKHITAEEDTTTDISPVTTGDEGDKTEEKPEVKMHELELTSTVIDDEKQVLEEVSIDQLTEPAFATEDDDIEVVTKQEMHENIQSDEDEDTRKQITEKGGIIEDSSQVSVSRMDAEGHPEKEKVDENDTVESKEEMKSSNSEVTEEIAGKGNEVSKSSEDGMRPVENIAEKPFLESKSKEEGSGNSLSVTGVTEEIRIEEVDQEDKQQPDSSGPGTQEKEPITVNTDETILDSVVTSAPQNDASNLVENKGHAIPAEANQDENDTKQEILKEHTEMSSEVSELVTSEESKPIDENSAKDATANGNTETASISSQATEHIQNKHEITAEDISEVQSLDTELQNEQNISRSEHVEISKKEETGDIVSQEKICGSNTSEDEEASKVEDMASKSTDSTNADSDEALLEDEKSAKKSEASFKEDDAVENAAAELEAEAEKQEVETTEIQSEGFPTDENVESAESSKKLDYTSDVRARDLSNKIVQETDPDRVEENSTPESVEQKSQEPQDSLQKTEEEIDPRFETEDHINETQIAEETRETAILTEEVQRETEKVDGGELVNQYIKEEKNLKELETVSIGDERVDEVSESSSTSTSYCKATETNEKTEIASLEVQEISNTKEKEETEVEAEGISTIAPNKDSEEVIKEKIIEVTDVCYDKEKATPVSEVTTGSKLKELHTGDNPVEVANFPADDSKSAAFEPETNQQDITAHEENSSNLASQFPTDDSENVKHENAAKKSDVDGSAESRKTSDVVEESKFDHVEEPHAGQIEDEAKEAYEMAHKSPDDEIVARSEVAIDETRTLPKEMIIEHETAALPVTCEEEKYETKATVENLEENNEKVSTIKDDSPENSSALEIMEDRCLQNEKPREPEVSQLDLEDKKAISDSPNKEYEKKGETLEEIKEVEEISETALKSNSHDLKAATEDEVADDQTLGDEIPEEQHQTESRALPSKEQELGTSTKVEETEENMEGEELLEDEPKTNKEDYLQKEESRELQVSELELDNPNEAQEEANETSVEIEDKKDASEFISEINSEEKAEPKEGEICSTQTNLVEKIQEHNQTPSSVPFSEEQKEETSVRAESTEERTKEIEVLEDNSEATEETCHQKEDPRELDVSELVRKSSPEENTAAAEYVFASDHTLPLEKSEEQNQTSSAALLSKEQKNGISTIAASIEEKAIRMGVPEDAKALKEEAALQEEEPRKFKPSELEPQLDNDVQEKSLEEAHEVEVQIPDEPLKLQPENKNEKKEAATMDMMAEENQTEKTTDATEFMHTEVTKEQIKEEKGSVITLDEAETKESHQENKLQDEESPGDKLLAKLVQNEELCKEIEKTAASKTTETQISTEKGEVENLQQAFVGKDTIKGHYPDEMGVENVEEARRKLNNENQDNEAIFGAGRTESTSAAEKELGVETSQKEITTSIMEATYTSPGIHREEKERASSGTSETVTSRDAEQQTMISTVKIDVPQVLQEPFVETPQLTEVGSPQPTYTREEVDLEAKRPKEQAENVVEEKAIMEMVSKDAAKMSLFDMMQRSRREKQVGEELTGEKEPMTRKEESETEEKEKAKSDEEEVEEEHEEAEEAEDEHKKNDSGSDAPVIVEASRDIDVKIVHKKSNNILSGVGSKVKHSIIKVKKAITGKSSHPKQHSPK